MIGQVIQYVPSLGGLQITMALVPVQVAMSDGVILESTVAKATHYEESFLGRLLSLQLIFFHFALA